MIKITINEKKNTCMYIFTIFLYIVKHRAMFNAYKMKSCKATFHFLTVKPQELRFNVWNDFAKKSRSNRKTSRTKV